MQRLVTLAVLGLAFLSLPLALWKRCGARAWVGRPHEADAIYFVSAVLAAPDKRDPSAARKRAIAAHQRIVAGAPFAEVARRESDDVNSRDAGGFLGVVGVYLDNAQNLHGAIQVLEEGQLSKPVMTSMGWYVVYRHSYEEGRRLEEHFRRPLYGLTLTYEGVEGGSGRTKEETLALGRRALGELRSGTLSVAEARRRYGPTSGHEREDGFVMLMPYSPSTVLLFDRLGQVAEGAWLAEPVDGREGIGLFRRGTYFRSVVRHILVQHIESEGRSSSLTRLKPEALVLAQRALERVRGHLDRWDATVISFTDEMASAQDRGSLGSVTVGMLPPALEQAVLDTPPGEVCSRLVETERGFHVLWRVD